MPNNLQKMLIIELVNGTWCLFIYPCA